jgi:hypothetical protein
MDLWMLSLSYAASCSNPCPFQACPIGQQHFNHRRKPRQFFVRRIHAWMSWLYDEASMQDHLISRVATRYLPDDANLGRGKQRDYRNIVQECEFGSATPSRSKMWILPLFLLAVTVNAPAISEKELCIKTISAYRGIAEPHLYNAIEF